jgi:hypothetical protein
MRPAFESKIVHALLTLLIASLVGVVGCGSDPAPPPLTSTCTGGDCACVGANECSCRLDDDCNVTCGVAGCSLACDGTSKCNANGEGAIAIECADDADCKGNGGDESTIVCTDTANCDLKAGDDSSARCEQTAECKINIGLRGSVQCVDDASCDIKCDGDCSVTCATTATCSVNCGTDDAGIAGQACPDGRIVCGACS